MSRLCQITGAAPRRGRRITHSGLSKKQGGIGLNHVKKMPRDFSPNLREKRIFVPELGRFVKVKLTARALKTVTKNGAYNVLKEAGLVK
jgi:large subunit ribosomal protein L28